MAHKSYISKRNFEEKKEAYVGFLDAMHASEIETCHKILETNPRNDGFHPDRPKALEELKEAIRADLKVA